MDEPTSRDIVHAMFFSPVASGSQPPYEHLKRQVDMLTTVVMDLLMEVEALREPLAGELDYRGAYLRTGLCTHDSTGPDMGWDKLLQLYYPRHKETTGRVWRESLMLNRLGFTASEIEGYRQQALDLEVRT